MNRIIDIEKCHTHTHTHSNNNTIERHLSKYVKQMSILQNLKFIEIYRNRKYLFIGKSERF